MLFGFLITTTEILNIESVMWSSIVIAMIYIFRAIQLKLIKLPMRPLLLIALRGLITILLFISIEPTQTIEMLNRSLIIQVIIVTALVMMIGLMTHKDKEKKVQSQLL
ncbi:MAG: hypothetical protein Q8T08_04670 [Ignavibacteria bacterium]|nr:hypothetical protein [Ignavibacteria bacterium]